MGILDYWQVQGHILAKEEILPLAYDTLLALAML